MEDYLERWITREGVIFLREIGLKNEQIVLDFGSGIGYYTIPSAKIVGDNGRVYALDKERDIISKLMDKAKTLGLHNITPVVSDKLDEFEEEFFDVILLYDVLHDYYFNKEERIKILEEVYRVSKYNNLVSVYPKHMDINEIIGELETVGFHFKNKFSKKLIHFYNYENGLILNFYK